MITIIYAIIIGLISCFFWGKAFSLENSTIIVVGIISGLILGLLISFFGKMAKVGGNLVNNEISFVNSSILIIIGGLLIVSGGIAFLVRYIFF